MLTKNGDLQCFASVLSHNVEGNNIVCVGWTCELLVKKRFQALAIGVVFGLTFQISQYVLAFSLYAVTARVVLLLGAHL